LDGKNSINSEFLAEFLTTFAFFDEQKNLLEPINEQYNCNDNNSITYTRWKIRLITMGAAR